MVKSKKEDGGASAEEQALLLESKRLKELAVSRGLLARSKANPSAPLLATKTIRKCDGKDIVKKGNRKTKYLFAFPGLVAPVAGGKFGELTHLDSRNPILYVDFPQGRLKLFGTIVYPKNKYLTMHFLPGRGDIICEDCFESIVVFPEAWWIGTKEQNPEEFKLSMPSNLQQEKHAEFDFTAGAGRCPGSKATTKSSKVGAGKIGQDSPEAISRGEDLEQHSSPIESADEKRVTLRQSARNSGKKPSYAFSLSSDSEGSNSDGGSESSDFKRKERHGGKTSDDAARSSQSGEHGKDKDIHDNSKGRKKTSVRKTIVSTLFESTSGEQTMTAGGSKGGYKQATLTAFMTKTTEIHEKAADANATEVPKEQEQGKRATPMRAVRKRRQSITELSSDTDKDESESDGAPSNDSDDSG